MNEINTKALDNCYHAALSFEICANLFFLVWPLGRSVWWVFSKSLKRGIRLQWGASQKESDKGRRVMAEAKTQKDWSGFLRQLWYIHICLLRMIAMSKWDQKV